MTLIPLADLRFSIAGPGRVGASLTAWLEAAGAQLQQVASRRGRMDRLGRRTVSLAELSTPGDHLLLLTLPAPALEGVARILADRPQASIVLHTAGSRSARVLEPLRRVGSRIGVIHPLRAFAGVERSPAAARNTLFTLGGDTEAIALGQRLAAAFGATMAKVREGGHSLYHLAAVLAAGGTSTLVATAARLGADLGLGPAALGAFSELSRGAVTSLRPEDLGSSITGPVARAEMAFFDQLDELRGHHPELHPVAVLLGLETLRQLALDGAMTPAHEALRAELQARCRAPDFLSPLLS